MGRAPCCEKVGLNRGRWTAEEDEKLVNYIKANGEGSWRSLPKNAGLLRCGKSCRLRWVNYLREDLKRGNFSAQEEETIIKLHSSIGNRWSVMAAQLPGRTDNEIKNYWNSHLSRRIHSFKRADSEGGGAVVMDLGRIVGIPGKRRRIRASSSATKKSAGGTVVAVPGGRVAGGAAESTSGEGCHEGDIGGSCGSVGCDQLPCGGMLPAGEDTVEAQSRSSRDMVVDSETLGEELLVKAGQLLPNEFWETTKSMAGELFIPSVDDEKKELSGVEGSPVQEETGDGGIWSDAINSLGEEREPSVRAAMSPNSRGQETSWESGIGGAPFARDDSDRLRHKGAPVDAVRPREKAAFPQASEVSQEWNSTATMGEWTDMELDELAATLWEENGRVWSWQNNWEETAAAQRGSGETMHIEERLTHPPAAMPMGGGFYGCEDSEIHSWLLSALTN